MDPTIEYFNYYKTSYYTSSCSKPKKTNLKKIEEDLLDKSRKEELEKEKL